MRHTQNSNVISNGDLDVGVSALHIRLHKKLIHLSPHKNDIQSVFYFTSFRGPFI